MSDSQINFNVKFDSSQYESSIKNMERGLDGFRKTLVYATKASLDTFGKGTRSEIEKTTIKLARKTQQVQKAINEIEAMRRQYELLAAGEVEPKILKSMNSELKVLDGNIKKEIANLSELNDKIIGTENKLEMYKNLSLHESLASDNISNYESTKEELNSLIQQTYKYENVIQSLTSKSNTLKMEMKDIKLNPSITEEASEFRDSLVSKQNELQILNAELNHLEGNIKRTFGVTPPPTFIESIKEIDSKISGLLRPVVKISTKVFLIDKIFGRLSSNVNKSSDGMKKFGENTAKSYGPLGKVLNRVKRIGSAVLFYQIFRSIFRSMRQGIEGLIKDNDRLSNSFNSLMFHTQVAFQPIWQTIVPYLQKAIDMLVVAMAYVAQLSNALFGKSLEGSKRAVKDLNAQEEAYKDTAKAAKKASKQVQGFDQLNKMQDKDDTDTEDNKSKSKSKDLDKFANVIQPKLDPKWLARFQDIMKRVRKAIDPTMKSLKNLWEIGLKPLGSFVWKGLEGFYEHFLKPVGTWVLGEGLPRLVDSLAITLSNVDWDTLNLALERLWDALAPLAIMVGEGLLWFWENVLMPLTEWSLSTLLPVVIEMIAAALDVLRVIIEASKPTFEWLWESFFLPLSKWIGDKVIKMIEGLTDRLEKFSKWASENQSTVDLIVTTLLGFFASVLFFAGVVKTIKLIADAIAFFGAVSLAASLGVAAVAVMIGILGGAVFLVSRLWSSLETGEKVLAALGLAAMAAAIAIAVFHTSWTLGAAALAIGLGIGGMVAVFAGVKREIGSMGGAGKKMSSASVPSSSMFSSLEAEDNPSERTPRVATNFIRSLNKGPNLPRLAKGGLIPPRKPRQVIVGDNMVEDEIVSPRSAMREEVQNAIKEMGGLGGNNDPAMLSILSDILSAIRSGHTIEIDGRSVISTINNAKGKTGTSLI